MGWNIGGGILLIILGLSGDFVLTGTDSSGWLVVFGIGLLLFGILQWLRSNAPIPPPPSNEVVVKRGCVREVSKTQFGRLIRCGNVPAFIAKRVDSDGLGDRDWWMPLCDDHVCDFTADIVKSPPAIAEWRIEGRDGRSVDLPRYSMAEEVRISKGYGVAVEWERKARLKRILDDLLGSRA